MVRFIPNLLTLANLVCGSVSIVLTLTGDPVNGAWFIIYALALDFFDGFFARMLNAGSEIGNFLDSLADVVSFGLAPAVIIFVMIRNTISLGGMEGSIWELLPYFSFIFTACAAYRLARFSISNLESHTFSGLPTPAAAIFILSLPMIMNEYNHSSLIVRALENHWILLVVLVILSLLMVSSFPMISLKFKTYQWSGNGSRFTLILLSAILLWLLQFAALPLIIASYLVISIVTFKVIRSR